MKEKNAEISARIAKVIETLGENPSSFSKMLGYNRAQTVYDIINGKSAPSYDFFKRWSNAEISAKIDLRWLLTGQGSMIKPDNQAAGAAAPKATPDATTEAHPDTHPDTYSAEIERLHAIIDKKDEKIQDLARQVGKLEGRIEQMQLSGQDPSRPKDASPGPPSPPGCPPTPP